MEDLGESKQLKHQYLEASILSSNGKEKSGRAHTRVMLKACLSFSKALVGAKVH